MSKGNQSTRPGHIAVAKMIAALVDAPQTSYDLIEASGLCHTTIRGYVRMLRKEGVLHVAAWEPDASGRMSLRAYMLGKGRDVRKPLPQFDHNEFQRRLRVKKRQMRMAQSLAGKLAA
jgi:hypothetical protein